MATGLVLRGFQKGDVFAIFSPNMPEYAVAFYGVARRRGQYNVNPLYTVEELPSSSTTRARSTC